MDTKTYLSKYDINFNNGFLPAQQPLRKLPSEYEIWDDFAHQFSGMLNSFSFRKQAEKMPVLNIEGLTTNAELERAMLLLSCFGHGFVWEGYESSGYLPESIAIPWTQVAAKLERKPSGAHASIVLQNWALIDENEPICLDNLRTLIQFHGGLDESWFYLVATEIEATGAQLLRNFADIRNATAKDDYTTVKTLLDDTLVILKTIWKILNRTFENCDPYIFFTRVRPFLASFNNIEYRGCNDNPRNYFGGSAAQSSLIQSIDAAFGVQHKEERSRFYLHEMRKYMPQKHAQFLTDLEAENFIETYVKSHSDLRGVFSDCMEALTEFRQLHLELVAKYIMAQTPKNGPGHTGTGGTNPMTFLKQVKKDTQEKGQLKSEPSDSISE
jgi:indoleamine 2,3-dioxygenase